MNWRILISPYTITSAFCIALLLLTVSMNGALWAYGFGALLLSLMFVLDRRNEYPALVWAVCFNWIAVVASILSADLLGIELSDASIGELRVEAVGYNLLALVVYSAGLGWAVRFGKGLDWLAQNRNSAINEHPVTLQTGVIAYFATLIFAELIGYIVLNIPQLQQPLIALFLLKYVFIYLVASTVFAAGRGYLWLAMMLTVEVVTGLTGFFGTFKEGFFIVLIAFIAAGRLPTLRMWTFGVASAVLVFVLSLLWTSVKPEYRRWVSGFSGEQIIVRSFDERVAWMADNLLESDFDYWQSLQRMVDRIDCTAVFAQYLAKREQDEIDLPSRFAGGLEHVLMPRFLFPGKRSLDDSAVTTAMTGRRIDSNTSISIGYLAEAHYDFGPWWMFVPIFLIGSGVGWAGRYFMTRDAPYLVRQSFATTVLFGFFQFGTNFDKALGTLLVGFGVLALFLRFAYPHIAFWLSGQSYQRIELAE
ncbi:MAG: hypothetical protein Q7T81_00500 [Pseudolabrys sp.]|nr:hypothetical protein [Pseudolabrys sp.]